MDFFFYHISVSTHDIASLFFSTRREDLPSFIRHVTLGGRGGPTSAQVLGAGGRGWCGFWPHRAQLQKQKGLKEKRRTSWQRRGGGASVCSFFGPSSRFCKVLLVGVRGRAREPFPEDTLGCLCIYVCTYIYTTLYKKALWYTIFDKKGKKKIPKNSFFHSLTFVPPMNIW